MEFFEVIRLRASVRDFQPHTIIEAQWETLLRAAMTAPSAVNCQPWDFVVIQDRAMLSRLADALPYAKMAAQASGAILVCTQASRAFQGSKDFAVIDASLACQNILLAATALDLGAVWTAIYPEKEREAVIHSLLGVPADVIPLALIPIGKPAGATPPKDKFKPDLIHRERW